MKSLLGSFLNRAPVDYVGSKRFSLPWSDKTKPAEAQMKAMSSVGTLFSIVNKTSNAVSQVEWGLYRTHDGRGRIAGEQDRREVTSHLALDVWNKPNPFYTRQEFVESFQQHVDLTGEGWWVVGTLNGLGNVPVELWPVRPDRMEPVPHPTDFLSGYVYTSPDGQKVPLDINEVIQIRMPNPLDPYRGLGPVQTLMVDLDSERYSAEWNRNFFLNSAEPGGIIEVDTRLSDPEFDEMRERWNEQHRGVSKAHRVAILEHGKWVNRQFSMRDMQFTELRTISRDKILEAFGMPRNMLGITEDVNRANAEAGAFVFSKWLVVPRLERIKQALNNDFLPMFGETGKGVMFDYCSPVDEDQTAQNAERDSKAAAAERLINTGFDPVDVLEVLGLPPMRFKEKTIVAAPTPSDPGGVAA